MARRQWSLLFMLPLTLLICILTAGFTQGGNATMCADESTDNVVLLQSAKVVRIGGHSHHAASEATSEPALEAHPLDRTNGTWSQALALVSAAASSTRHGVLHLLQHASGQQSGGTQWTTVDVDIIIAALVFLMPILCFVVSQENAFSVPSMRLPQMVANMPNFNLGPALAYSRGGAGSGDSAYASANGQQLKQHQADQAAGLKSGGREILDGAAALRYLQQQQQNQPWSPPSPPPALAAAGWPGPSVEEDMFGTYLVLQDAVPVSSGVGLNTSVVGSLSAGEAVTVLEVQWADGTGHLRGRLKFPDGWMSLVNVQDGRQWAVKRSPGPIIMDGLLDGSKVGLSLNQDLIVTRLVDSRAAQFGWCIGDHVLQVNGVPVKGEADFMDEIHRAAVTFKSTGHPITFHVVRAQPIESEEVAKAHRQRAGRETPHKAAKTLKTSCF